MNNNKISQHTPGPWKIGKHGSVITTTPDKQVEITGKHAKETIEWYGGHVICETATKANAALIAAAPDLLEILKAFIVEYEIPRPIESDESIDRLDAIYHHARAAIAKAEAQS